MRQFSKNYLSYSTANIQNLYTIKIIDISRNVFDNNNNNNNNKLQKHQYLWKESSSVAHLMQGLGKLS